MLLNTTTFETWFLSPNILKLSRAIYSSFFFPGTGRYQFNFFFSCGTKKCMHNFRFSQWRQWRFQSFHSGGSKFLQNY